MMQQSWIEDISREVKPGDSAVFIYAREAVADKIMPQLKQLNPRIIQTSLSNEAEARLKEALGAEEPEVVGTAGR